jgi:glycerate kinase
VDNPLTGQRGAAAVYGPQKGATPAMVEALDANLRHWAELIRRDLGVAVSDLPGAGAAGGLGAGLVAFCNAELRPGIEIVIEATRLADRIRDADLVITGEGRLDGQSMSGKTAVGVARLARRLGVRVIAIVGSLGDGHERTGEVLDACHAIQADGMEQAEAMARVTELLEETARRVMRSGR